MFEGEIEIVPVIIISLAAAGLSVKLSRWANGKYLRPTISNWFMWWLFTYIYIGTSYLMVVKDSYEDATGLFNHPEAIMGAWGLALAGIIFIPMGMNIANLFWNIKPNFVWKRFVNDSNEIVPQLLPRSFHVAFFALTVFTLLVTFIYYQQIDIPIMGVFSGADAKTLALLRSDATNNFDGKLYQYNLFKTSLLTILMLISFFLRHIRLYRYVFFGLLGVRIFACLADIQKGPIVNLIIMLLLAWYYEKHNINKRLLLVIGVIIVGMIITMYVFFMGADISDNELFSVTIAGILRRVFVGQSVGVEWSIVYVDKHGFLDGASMPNPAGLLPFTYVRYSVDLMEMVFPHLVSMGMVGSMPTVFWGEIYANFGEFITILSMFIVGILLRTFDIYFQTHNAGKKFLNLVLYLFMIVSFQKYTGSSILGIFIDQDLWLTIFVVTFLSYWCRGGNKKRRGDSIGAKKHPTKMCTK